MLRDLVMRCGWPVAMRGDDVVEAMVVMREDGAVSQVELIR